MKPQLIAMDGPVAAGKSSVGQLLAHKLGYCFIDTGNMYRAVTWKAIESGLNLDDEASLSQLAATIRIEFNTSLSPEKQGQHIVIDGQDVASHIRDPDVEKGVPLVSKIAKVREVMVQEQRRIAGTGKIVMAGRDIGTVVLPQAELKIYLVASAEERAHRRYQELSEQGATVNYDAILDDLKIRDQTDSQRAISPLRPAPDARIINTEHLNRDQVVEKIYSLVEDN